MLRPRHLVSYVGHRGRELLLHLERFRQDARLPRLMIMPSVWGVGTSSDLRAVAIGRELTRMGWRVSVVPPQLEWEQRQRVVQLERPHVILFQQSRHPCNRPRLYPGIPCVLDADDADIADPSARAPAVECCRDSAAVIAGNTYLASLFSEHNDHVHVVWTSTHLPYVATEASAKRRRAVVTWAQLDALSWTAEAELVREVVSRVAQRARFEFLLIGEPRRDASEAFLRPLRSARVTCRAVGRLPYGKYLRLLESAAIGLNPSSQAQANGRGRSFGKLLGYIAARVAVVTANVSDYPEFFEHEENSLLAEEANVSEWTEHCLRLLDDAELRLRLTDRALLDVRRRLTTATAAGRVDGILRDVLARGRRTWPLHA